MIFAEKSGKYYFHYPFPVAIVGSKWDNSINFMSAAWHTQISFDPPLYGVAISPKRFTKELIEKSGVFSLNFIKYDDYKISGFVGRTSGKDFDKINFFGIKYIKGKKLDVPILENAVACYECKLIDSKTYGDHILYVGEIVGIHYNENEYKDGISDGLLLYAGNDMYTKSENTYLVKFGKEEVKKEIDKRKKL